jgi:predicted nucleic acid-binding protein
VGVLYLDASAVAKIRLDEPGSRELVAVVGAATGLATSIITLIEVPRAVARVRSPLTDGEARALFDGMAIIGLDRTITAKAAALAPPALRTLDAIHLASALELGADLEAFVTYDRRLAEAAAAAELPVTSPDDSST